MWQFVRILKGLHFIAPAPHHGKNVQDAVKKLAAGLLSLSDFGEDNAVTQKQNAVGITCGKGVVRYHEDSCAELSVDFLQGGKQHLGRMAVQRAGRFVR